MPDKPSENHSPILIEKKCRIVLDVKIIVSQITREGVADCFTPSETGEGLTWEWAERQNRLLLAFLEDKEVLEEFLIRTTRDEIEMHFESDNSQYRNDDDLFERVYSRMGDDDALYFREAQDEGLLDENLELFDRAFVFDWKSAETRSIEIVEEQDTTETS